MNDLIRRQAAIDALEDAGMTNYQATGDFYGIINALTVIKNLPTAEKRTEGSECVMTPAEFEEKMWRIKIRQDSTPEYDHIDADRLICELLNDLGYGGGVRSFEDMEKWYS